MGRVVLTAVVTLGCLPWGDAFGGTALPDDTVWFACNGYGVRVVGGTESETTPDTDGTPGVYAASLSARTGASSCRT